LSLLRVDHRALLQVVLNLVSNTVSFTERGGSVTFTTALSAGGELEITSPIPGPLD